MAVYSVHVQGDVFRVCLAHALTTEREEIMGLLIGEIDETRVSHISAVIALQRSDKQPDRVEISPEQLMFAATEAERLALELNRPMRVLGWYHSHPHITVWPSHVDVRTQATYQLMDEGFIGLIFSVFNENKNSKVNKIQMTCFQSINQSPEGEPPQYMRLEVPVHVIPRETMSAPCIDSLVSLPNILFQEEQDAYEKTASKDLDLIAKLHNTTVYTLSLCQVTEVLIGPLIQTLENRLLANNKKIQTLNQKREDLLRHLQEISK